MAALSPQWHECMQWAVRECERLGMEFDLSVDFGYGSGGPHITPELSMQKLYWSETEVEGGQDGQRGAAEARRSRRTSRPGCRPGRRDQREGSRADRENPIPTGTWPWWRFPLPASPQRARVSHPGPRTARTGLTGGCRASETPPAPPPDAVTPLERVVDLTGRMDADGRLTWDAPPGKWLIIRYGHASNFKMTRPCPAAAVGLECDRLAKAGIERTTTAFLKKIFDGRRRGGRQGADLCPHR